MNRKLILGFLLLVFSLQALKAQVKFEVKLDSALINSQDLYMASSANGWNPRDTNWKLKKISSTIYSLEIPEDFESFEYKYTQGNWNLVEAALHGRYLENRIYLSSQNPAKLIKDTVVAWEKKPHYEITINKIPDNTPEDANIYISGNFNNWLLKDKLYKLKKQFDGSYKVTIYTDLDKLEFKFNRGDWSSAESWNSGKARPNRILFKSNLSPEGEKVLEIENWEDLNSTFSFFSIIDLFLLFAAFQGILLMIVIPTIQDFNVYANRLLVILLGISSFFIFFKVISDYREVANTFPKLILLSTLVLFTYSPLLYLYIRKLLFNVKFSLQKSWPHLVLPALQLLAYIPYIFMEGKRFQHKIVNHETDLKIVYALLFFLAIFSNLYYYFKSKKTIEEYSEAYLKETAYHQNINYLSAVLNIFLVCIILGIFTAIIFTVNLFSAASANDLVDNSISLIWITFSLKGFILGYYAIHQPEIFKVNREAEIQIEHFTEEDLMPEPEILKVKNTIATEELEQFKLQIEDLMLNQKPFLNPNLTLNDLAILMKIPSHTLSKIIKEGYSKNFFDFVNTYRIEEFKKNIENSKYLNYTLLGIAFEVGFNSKTAFNRSFKKITNQTPSEYYQSRK